MELIHEDAPQPDNSEFVVVEAKDYHYLFLLDDLLPIKGALSETKALLSSHINTPDSPPYYSYHPGLFGMVTVTPESYQVGLSKNEDNQVLKIFIVPVYA
jgi:hypothetical protein